MTIGPEPMIRIFLRSVRLGTQAPRPRRLFFDQPIDDRRLRHGLFTAVEDVVQTPPADPDDLAVPPQLPPQNAPAPPHALAGRRRVPETGPCSPWGASPPTLCRAPPPPRR